MDTVINIRTNKEIRNKAKKVFSSLGISTSAGVNMFLNQVALEQGLPFTPTIDPKKLRAKWDKEIKEAIASGKRYKTAKELHDDILGER